MLIIWSSLVRFFFDIIKIMYTYIHILPLFADDKHVISSLHHQSLHNLHSPPFSSKFFLISSKSSWFTGVTVTNSRNCTCHILMLLLLVSMLIMSTKTTYILCIPWKISPTYTEDCLENCATKPIGHHVTSQWFDPT